MMGSLKFPSPNCFKAIFYKKFWNVIKRKLLFFFRIFFSWVILASFSNHTFIFLIPKVSNASFFKDLRIIRLCNTIYKIILKISANKLRSHVMINVSGCRRLASYIVVNPTSSEFRLRDHLNVIIVTLRMLMSF